MYKMGSVDGMVSFVDHRRRETGSGMPSLIFFSNEYYSGISLAFTRSGMHDLGAQGSNFDGSIGSP